MQLSYNHSPVPAAARALGPDHLEITLHIGAADQEALGMESGIVTEWFVTALRTLAALRTGEVDRETAAAGIERGPVTVDTWYWAINDLETHLIPAVLAIRDAAIRKHAEAGGSVGNLGLAMNVSKSTAQSRREQVLARPLTEREDWAINGHAGRFAERRGLRDGE